MDDEPATHRYRAIFLSDVHLGTKGCQADTLIDFLRHHDADVIYLVGDIFDGWQLRSTWYWPQSHSDVLQKLLRKARKGTRLVYVPGNHDEVLRSYYGMHFGGIEVVEQTIHVASDGRRYLVLHGDLFDAVIKHARWLAFIGDSAYTAAIIINTVFNRFRRMAGLGYWSLSQWAKLQVKTAVNFIGEFEDALILEAKRHGTNGIICGHIHHASIRDIRDLRYMNCGDWVESCTAVCEGENGEFNIVTWAIERGTPVQQPASEAQAA